ncbi:MAG: hypothetical protein AAFZ52_08145 [Bacteroidota bacterium]
MKYGIIIYALLFAGGLCAQTKATIVAGIETDNRFTFSIKVDRKRVDALEQAYLSVVNVGADTPLLLSSARKIDFISPVGTLLTFDPTRNSLKIKGEKKNQESIAEARQWANIVRAEMGLTLDPSPE